MNHAAKSLRPFVGARDFGLSRTFYKAIGFEELVISPKMMLMRTDGLAFYLQDYYVEDWINNTMLFLEVDRLDDHYATLTALDLPAEFPAV